MAEPIAPPRPSGWMRLLNPFRPRGVEQLLEHAQQFVLRRNFTQAMQAYSQVLESDGRCVKAHQGLASLLVWRGGRENLNRAQAHLLEAVQIDPYDPQTYRINAAIFKRLGRLKRMAVELRCMAITHTLRRQPEHPVAHNQMGVLLLRQFRMDLAMDHFQRAVQAQPRYEVALRNLARACFVRAEVAQDAKERTALLQDAGGHVQAALEIAPSAAAWATLARIRLLNGQPREALEAVEAGEQLRPASRELPALRAEAELALATLGAPAQPEPHTSAPVRVG